MVIENRTHVREHIFACTKEKSYEGKQKKSKKTENKQSKTFGDRFFSFGDNIDFSIRAAATANAGTADSSRTKYYASIQIEKGTSLWKIAGDYMTEEYHSEQEYIEEVMQMNHLESDIIYEGAYLCVPYYSSEQK
ncbi:MAG: hypothetical protein ACLRMZ_22700 [Blautia marasmi]